MPSVQEECRHIRKYITRARYELRIRIPEMIIGDLATMILDYLIADTTILDVIKIALPCYHMIYFSRGRVHIYCKNCPIPGHHIRPYKAARELKTPSIASLYGLYNAWYTPENDTEETHKHSDLVRKWLNAIAAVMAR